MIVVKMGNQYRNENQEINKVLKYHQEKLEELKKHDLGDIDENIRETEELLRTMGIQVPDSASTKPTGMSEKRVVKIPSWDELVCEANSKIKQNVSLESLFSEEELDTNRLVLDKWEREFNSIHTLDKYDIAICAVAAIIGAAIELMLVGIPKRTPEGTRAGPLSNYIRDWFEKRYPEEEMTKLANNKISKVPFDAQDNRHTTIQVEGLSAYYHRLLELGHDPLLGFFVGVLDIMNGSMTTIDKNGKVVVQVIKEYSDRKESDLFSALAKQLTHLKTDVTTSMGLPAPLMGLFNLLQFGSIGEENQTIAEIVQGMYYEGYDFIHFCSLSIPVMITEVIVRVAYALKRIKEGYSIKDSLPLSNNRQKHPKLATMLFIAHSGATAVNLGKILFTRNPLSINYPQWVAFGKYSYQQLRWTIIEKPTARYYFLEDKIDEELKEIYADIDKIMNQMSDSVIFVDE